jgi:hypothetical protein
MAHEILVDLFKNRPSLAAEILAEVLGVSLPAYTESRLASTDLTEIQPAEYRADIVVAPDPAVARWCADPIEIGVPGFVLHPPVLYRTTVPVVTDPGDASRRPELGVLSAMAHGDTEQGATIAAALLPAIRELDEDRAKLYYDLVYNSLNEAARRAMEAMMKGYEYQSDFAKKYVAQGRTEEAARNLLTVLRARGIAVTDAIRERILAQKDPELLERWLEKAAVAASVTSVIDEPN